MKLYGLQVLLNLVCGRVLDLIDRPAMSGPDPRAASARLPALVAARTVPVGGTQGECSTVGLAAGTFTEAPRLIRDCKLGSAVQRQRPWD